MIFRSGRRYQAARSNVDVAKANSLSTREQVILLVVSQYIGTLRAVANVEASKSRVELAQALYDQAADLQKEGVGTGIDTLRANVELQNEKQRLIEAENDRDSSLFGLSKLLNLDPRQKIELADSLGLLRHATARCRCQHRSGACHPPGVESHRSTGKIRGLRQTIGRNIRACLRCVSTATGPISALPPATAFPRTYTRPRSTCRSSPAAAFSAEVTKADLELQKIEQQKADLRNQIALDVKTSLLNLQFRAQRSAGGQPGRAAGQGRSGSGPRPFQAGVANNIEVISAQDSLARANDNQIVALYRFNQARADFARSVGQMEKTYSK